MSVGCVCWLCLLFVSVGCVWRIFWKPRFSASRIVHYFVATASKSIPWMATHSRANRSQSCRKNSAESKLNAVQKNSAEAKVGLRFSGQLVYKNDIFSTFWYFILTVQAIVLWRCNLNSKKKCFPPPVPLCQSPDTPAHLDPADRILGLTSQHHLVDRWIPYYWCNFQSPAAAAYVHKLLTFLF